jgi:hypothetical protein
MGEYKVWVDSEGIIRGKIIGDHTKEDAIEIIKELQNHFLKDKGNLLAIIDMSETNRPSSGSRKVHAMNLKNNHDLFKKAAFFGASVMNRVLANFIIKASGKGDKVRYFDTQQEAIQWLKI